MLILKEESLLSTLLTKSLIKRLFLRKKFALFLILKSLIFTSLIQFIKQKKNSLFFRHV